MGWDLKERLPSDKPSIDGIGDDSGQHAVNESSSLEVHAAVKNLNGEDGGPDGGTKDRGKPGGHPHQDHQSPFILGPVEQLCVDGAKAGGYECGGAFASCGSSGADGNRGGKHLYRSYARPDGPSCPVKCFHNRIRAVAFCFGCEAVNKRSRQQSPDGCGDRYQPQPMRTDDFSKNSALFGSPGGW